MSHRAWPNAVSPRCRRSWLRLAVLCALMPATALWAAAGLLLDGQPAMAAGSGTNGLILFAGWPSGAPGSQLYTYDPASGSTVNVSGSSVGDDEGEFSPSGKTIAYRHGGDIWTMNADGSSKKQVVHFSGGVGSPSWSPDGTQLTFDGAATGQAGPDIWTASSSNGSGAKQLTTDHHDMQPVWSPDGKWIAFTSTRDGNSEIYRMASDGTGQTNLTNNPSVDNQPAWSPDSTNLVFTSTRNHSHSVGPDLWTMTVATKATSEFDHQPDYSDGLDATYSPDGTRIAFAANNGTGATQLWDAPAGGGTNTRLSALPGNPGVNSIDWQQAPASK